VVVTGTLQIVEVVTGGGAVVVVVVAPGMVVVATVVVVGAVVVGTGVQTGLGFFTVVVVTGFLTGFFGRLVLTTRETVACQRTRVPARGDWRRTTIHFPFVLPGPRVVKNSWACFMTA
jgi:hypothetical protein